MYGSCNRLEKATHNHAKIQELTGFDIMSRREEKDYGQSTRATATMAITIRATTKLVSPKSRKGIASTTPTAEAAST